MKEFLINLFKKEKELELPHPRIKSKYASKSGSVKYFFDNERALAILLHNNVLFCNTGSFDNEDTVCLFVLCNDLFMWGCADGEEVTSEEIESLFNAWENKEDKGWGVDKWCCKRRGYQPQWPIKEQMIKVGVWDEEMEKLNVNPSDPEWDVEKHGKMSI